MKFAAIYARSSLGKEKQGDTVEHQIEMIKEYARRINMDVIFDDKFIYEEDGESGFKTTLLQRPAMRRLLEDIDNELIGVVFFKGISRFARDSGETITAAKRLSTRGVRVISLEENYDSFRDDPTMFQIFAVIAEQESRKTSIRVSLGNKQKARNGLWSGSITPLGYTKVKDIPDIELKGKLLVSGVHPHSLHPDENAPIVKRIFEMFVLEKLGRKRITGWLNTNGHKTTRGRAFQEKNVLDILKNEVYIGNIVYGKTRYEYIENEDSSRKIQKTVNLNEEDWVRTVNSHPPIISKELFHNAQEELYAKALKHGKGRRFNASKHPLTSILKCGKCGEPMICQKRSNIRKDGTKLEYRYYVCSTYHKKGRIMCDQRNIKADLVEQEVLSIVKSTLDKYLENWNLQSMKEREAQNSTFKTEIKSLEGMIHKKIKASKHLLESKELYDLETFISLNKEIQDDIKRLREEKFLLEKELEKRDAKSNVVKLEKMFREFMSQETHELSELKKIFQKLVREVIYTENEVKEVHLFAL